MKSNDNYDVIIIGAGPGGISAAIYLKRAGINPLIIEADAPGGTLNKTHKIENYPGYVDKDGTTLAFRMYSQIEELGVAFKTEKVINIENENNFHKVITENNVYECKYIIIATGKIRRKLDIKDADKYNTPEIQALIKKYDVNPETGEMYDAGLQAALEGGFFATHEEHEGPDQRREKRAWSGGKRSEKRNGEGNPFKRRGTEGRRVGAEVAEKPLHPH